MIDYDTLKMAADYADTSENMETHQWMEAEGFVQQDTLTFSKDEGIRMLASITPLLDRLPHGPMRDLSLVMTGILSGLRYANLIHRIQDVDPEL